MLRILSALNEPALSQVRNLFREYASTPGVAPCLIDFERELTSLPGQYGPPGGRLLVAWRDDRDSPERAIGCVAMRRLEERVCEMKRLYVRAASRGDGAGRALIQALISEARSIGYERMVLDTLPSMEAAHKLYRALGFREISSYQKNPAPGSLFFELDLH